MKLHPDLARFLGTGIASGIGLPRELRAALDEVQRREDENMRAIIRGEINPDGSRRVR